MFLYYLIIHPIHQLIEICYILFKELTKSPGLSVIALSFVVTIFCLPLYIVAEKWQEKERCTAKQLELGIKRIKKAFKGDEQYMMLTTFYAENRYHPIMALRSSFGLLIQIPFFIAAYSFLSNLGDLQGARFLFIRNMGAPDGLFTLGTTAINVLPIAMTLLNCISGAVYSHGHSAREKAQIYISAVVFLIILYPSPAGLVMYWTMNNLLSLVKNVFYKLKHPVKVLYCIAAAAAICALLLIATSLKNTVFEIRMIFALVCLLIIASPLLYKLLLLILDNGFTALDKNKRIRDRIFLLSALALSLLAGLFIPSTLIESEPTDFCYVESWNSPFHFLMVVAGQAFGLFLFWPACFYYLFGTRVKKILSSLFAILAIYAIANSLLFSGNYGPMTQLLEFMEPQKFKSSAAAIAVNIGFLVATLAVLLLLFKRNARPLIPVMGIISLGFAVAGMKNCAVIQNFYTNMEKPVLKTEIEPIYHLSKDGQNVIVIMQDRLFSPYVQEVFAEFPDYANKFDGFVYYPNAVSFGQYTMIGTPGIFGGYDYTPFEINRAKDKTLQQKHNEAILSMPRTFTENGWSATVSDMPYENYLEQPTTVIYEPYPDIQCIDTHGVYTKTWFHTHGVKQTEYIAAAIRHNLIKVSIFKVFPPFLRRLVYHKDWWTTGDTEDQLSQFIDNYSELDYLPELFTADGEKSALFILDNEATHEPTFLQAPDYTPVETVTDRGNAKLKDKKLYHATVATFRCYAKFFDYLKKNNVYDNTRIIIVSDHGATEDYNIPNPNNIPPHAKEKFVATVLFKDFNARYTEPMTKLQEDMTLMTNADTPALATKGIFPNAKNPFTGNPYAVEDKSKYIKICNPEAQSTRTRNESKFHVDDDGWYTVKDNIFEPDNWGHLDKEYVRKLMNGEEAQ